jgi:hypothetical protein
MHVLYVLMSNIFSDAFSIHVHREIQIFRYTLLQFRFVFKLIII